MRVHPRQPPVENTTLDDHNILEQKPHPDEYKAQPEHQEYDIHHGEEAAKYDNNYVDNNKNDFARLLQYFQQLLRLFYHFYDIVTIGEDDQYKEHCTFYNVMNKISQT
eukprot:2455616-Amphidinium_carterae.3